CATTEHGNYDYW
nr:immunoglobulin heavy chain junction region [Macaca mulatta]